MSNEKRRRSNAAFSLTLIPSCAGGAVAQGRLRRSTIAPKPFSYWTVTLTVVLCEVDGPVPVTVTM